jgi:tRNA pseudouridine55 synthase
VECGKGTYIRSLAHDIGAALGCGAHLSRLERTRIGPFTVGEAVASGDLPFVMENGSWEEALRPVDYGLVQIPALTLGIEDEKDIRHGQAVELDEATVASLTAITDGLRCRAYAEDGSFVAVIAYDTEGAVWRPRKVFSAG